MFVVADNLQITDPVVEAALARRDPGPIQKLVKACEAAGARAIDVNPGPLPRQAETQMTFLVETVQAVTDLPLWLDTTNARALSAGLSVARRPVTLNGFSLEPAKLETILPLAVAHEAAIIGYLLEPDSQVPVDETDCLNVAVQLLEACQAAGLDAARQLIVDPVLAPLIWENGARHNQAVLSVLRHLPDLFGFTPRSVVGLSNLTVGPVAYLRKIQVEKTFLPMLAAAGLRMVLLNTHHVATIACAQTSSRLLQPGIFAWEEIPV